MIPIAFVALDHVMKQRKKGARYMDEKEIHSRRTLYLPRFKSAKEVYAVKSVVWRRLMTRRTKGSRNIGRRVYFDYDTNTLIWSLPTDVLPTDDDEIREVV